MVSSLMIQKNKLKRIEYSNHSLKLMSNSLRFLSACMVNKAGSGHLGMPLGMADVATVLWAEFLDFDPKNPNRDRFVLSCGHGSALLYSLLHFFDQLSTDDLKNFRKIGSKTPGHPEYNPTIGIELTTGPLGQGLACSIGMTSSKFWTYVFCSDGDLMEGIAHETLAIAARFSQIDSPIMVQNLLVFWDDNGITIDGKTELSCKADLGELFLANGWNLIEVDGHNYEAIRNSIVKAKTLEGPTCIRCKTTIGLYMDSAGTEKAHSGKIKDLETFKSRIGMIYPDFELPDSIYKLWDGPKERGKLWIEAKPKESSMEEFIFEEILDGIKGSMRDDLLNTIEVEISKNKKQVSIMEYNKDIALEATKGNVAIKINPSVNLRKSLEKAFYLKRKTDLPKRISTRKMLEYIFMDSPNVIAGSADLGESTCVAKSTVYLHFGIREHAMIAFAIGRSLLGHRIPVATFLSFTDYAKPAIRLAAMMQADITIIATHDSIGVGEDGPTHQPIEQLWSLRLIPGLKVFRPANFDELQASIVSDGPSIIACSRQEVSNFYSKQKKCALGGYVLSEEQNPIYTLIATGSEVEIAFSVAEILPGARIVSMPCLEEFEAQSSDYKASVLGKLPRFSIEAGVTTPWYRYVDLAFGVDQFGESGPCEALFDLHLNPKKIASRIKSFLELTD